MLKATVKKEPTVHTSGYLQVVPNSHRYTLYGLKMELEKLKALLIVKEQPQEAINIAISIVEKLIKGTENSIAADTDQSTVI